MEGPFRDITTETLHFNALRPLRSVIGFPLPRLHYERGVTVASIHQNESP